MSIGKTNPIALSLQEIGLSVRDSTWMANKVFTWITEALQRGEQVDLPFGMFKVIKQYVKPYRRWRFGQPHTAYAHENRVVFIPKKEVLT